MQGPRLLAFVLPLTLWVSNLVAAPAYYTESAVTLQLTVRSTSLPVRSAPDDTGLIVEETQIESRRLGNADILAELARRSLIPSAKGHSLVAVWADWPDEKPFKGSAFRLFVRKAGAKQHALAKVPSDVFGITPEDWLRERNLLRRSGALKSGTSSFEAYSELSFQARGVYGTLLGRDIGGGVFKTPPQASWLQYLPRPGSMSLDGVAGAGVCSGEVNFGKARFIPVTDFQPNALPKNVRAGGFYGYSSSGDLSAISVGWWKAPPPFVNYFCPLGVTLTLKKEERVATTEKGREITRISSSQISLDDLLRGTLRNHGIDDTTGWGFYLHARSDEYTSLADLGLVVAHADGRILYLGKANFTSSYGKAEEARREYRDGVYLAGTIRTLAHLTHDLSWNHPDGRTLRLLGTGAADIASRFGPIPEAQNLHHLQPVSATSQLFGSYSTSSESGLMSMSVTIGSPVAQSEIPSGWHTLFPRYRSYFWPYPIDDVGAQPQS
jgi:hypothetical protein